MAKQVPPTPTATSSKDQQASDDAWRQRGASQAPPSSVRDVSLEGIEVVNQTGGAVHDADARKWAEAFMRTANYEVWAFNAMEDRFLLQGGLSKAPSIVFHYDVDWIARARAAGARIDVSRQHIRRLLLRPVPTALQPLTQQQYMVWNPYAFYLDAVGPTDLSFLDGQGVRTRQDGLSAGESAAQLVGGELLKDPLLGDVWMANTDWACSTTSARQSLGPLCNP